MGPSSMSRAMELICSTGLLTPVCRVLISSVWLFPVHMHVWCSNLEPAFQSQVSSKRRHIESLLLSQWNRQYFDNFIFSWTEARFALSSNISRRHGSQQYLAPSLLRLWWILLQYHQIRVSSWPISWLVPKLYDSLQYLGISNSTTTFIFQPFFTKYLVRTHYNYLL